MFCLKVLLLLFSSFAFVLCQTTFKEKEAKWKSEFLTPVKSTCYPLGIRTKAPSIFVAIFVRNKEHSLPYFINAFENLNYPKDRMSLWIVSDHNIDNSVELLEHWLANVHEAYHEVELETPESEGFYPDQQSDVDWTDERYVRMLKLRQEALEKARRNWADYILFIDADNILMNPDTLWHLISDDVTIVAPMLNSVSGYSNFWCGQDETGFFKETEDYFSIRNRNWLGTFTVPVVHSTFLIHLAKTDSSLVQFWPIRDDYQFALDDIVVFSMHTKSLGVKLHINNKHFYGYLPVPMEAYESLSEEKEEFVSMLMDAITEPPVGIGIEILPSKLFDMKQPTSKLGFDEVYLINLDRRPDRYYRMKSVLELQGIDFTHFHGIDSKSLNESYLERMEIEMLPGFVDPYLERTLTRGEIGCFLSHYFIWKEVVDQNLEKVMVFEDDCMFESGFVRHLQNVMKEIIDTGLEWDLIYIGRKRMYDGPLEKRVEGSRHLLEADYSVWTIGYLLSNSGARKLLAGNPLPKMVPVDEYIPIMANKHPKREYMKSFKDRNLVLLALDQLLIYPTHFPGENNYFTDTEWTPVWGRDEKKDEL